MKRTKQLQLESQNDDSSSLKSQRQVRNELRFGGSLMKKAKGRVGNRPVSAKVPMHLVLRSSKAKGRFSFAHSSNLKRVNEIVRKSCTRYGVKLIEYSNNFNHLHLLVKFPSRAVYLRFIRSLTGHLALAVTKANKNQSLNQVFEKNAARLTNDSRKNETKKFWDYRPFTRVIRSYRGYRVAKDYVVLNQLEALGILPKRSGRLREVSTGEKHLFGRAFG